MFDIAAAGLPLALAIPLGQIENAHLRLARRVQEMSQAEVDFTGPAGNVNSTGMLLAHIALTDWVYLQCIKGETVSEEPHPVLGPHEDAQGNLPAVSGVPVADLLARLAGVREEIRAYLQTCTEAEAQRAVKVPWWPEEATVRYVLWHMAGHCMNHIGQIDRLKGFYKQG
ncbi:MAG TPA: DinB family protein [Symbiobacteriaceae bacterium]|nr:DinB family protein [Symbiobacteriaceae bacterium]